MKTIVVIGFAEALSAPEVAWSLVDHGFEVIAFARKGSRAALRHSRLVRVLEVTPPETDFARTSEDLKSAVSRIVESAQAPVVVMPLDDPALWLCGHADLGAGVVLVGPQGQALDLALDKRIQLQVAEAAGFAVPLYHCVNEPDEISTGELEFPVVFKPALAVTETAGRLFRGHGWICADRGELGAAMNRWGGETPMILQRFIPGVGEGIFGLAAKQGVSAWSGHRRVRMMNPQGSGSSACTAVSPIDEESRARAERFLGARGWRGLFMVELLRDRGGKQWFVEFNGRPWGSMALARRMGFEYPAWAAATALNPGITLQIPDGKGPVPLCRHLAREILYLLFVARGSRSKALDNWPSIWEALGEVCKIGPNDRWYNWRRNDPKVFFGDCIQSLWSQLAGAKLH